MHLEIIIIKLKRLPGQYYDEETGLHYNYFRYYDPSIGRYITADPVGLIPFRIFLRFPSINGRPLRLINHLYNYVDANPIDGYDLFGLQRRDIYRFNITELTRLRPTLIGSKNTFRTDTTFRVDAEVSDGCDSVEIIPEDLDDFIITPRAAITTTGNVSYFRFYNRAGNDCECKITDPQLKDFKSVTK